MSGDKIYTLGEVLPIGKFLIIQWVKLGMIKRAFLGGSVARRYAMVGDLEIMIEPAYGPPIGTKTGQQSLFEPEETAEAVNLFNHKLQTMLDDIPLLTLGEKDGPRQKKFYFPVPRDRPHLPIDLFMADPEQWGIVKQIRTGPGKKFNRPLMTWLKDINHHVSDGRLHAHKKFEDGPKNDGKCQRPKCRLIIPTPTEKDFFEALGLEWIPPGARTTESLKMAIVNRSNRISREARERARGEYEN